MFYFQRRLFILFEIILFVKIMGENLGGKRFVCIFVPVMNREVWSLFLLHIIFIITFLAEGKGLWYGFFFWIKYNGALMIQGFFNSVLRWIFFDLATGIIISTFIVSRVAGRRIYLSSTHGIKFIWPPAEHRGFLFGTRIKQ